MKRYKYTFANDDLTMRFYLASIDKATTAGGSLWYSLSFEEPGTSPFIFLELPDAADPTTVAPLPDGAAWTLADAA